MAAFTGFGIKDTENGAEATFAGIPAVLSKLE